MPLGGIRSQVLNELPLVPVRIVERRLEKADDSVKVADSEIGVFEARRHWDLHSAATIRGAAEPEGRPSSALEVKRPRRHTAPVSNALTIAELAKRSGVRTSALRFYEERGLLRSERNSSGHRRYQRAAIRQVAFIVFAQNIGMSLEEVGRLLDRLPSKRAPVAADWAKLSKVWVARVDERIAELQRLRANLTECIGCGCLSLESCQLANPSDRAGRLGPGPRYWISDADRRS